VSAAFRKKIAEAQYNHKEGKTMQGEKEAGGFDDLISDKELAGFLGVSRATLLKFRKEKGLPFIKLGIKTLYYKPDVLKWLVGRTQNKVG
jgi:excisionase family DNA binding protein